MKLHPIDVPVAVSMLDLAKTTAEPFQQFICYWIAFNNIYAVTADTNGLSATVITKPDGSPRTRVIANVEIAVSSGPKEIEQIRLARSQLSDDLKHGLIIHESTGYFAYRVPVWKGREIKYDAFKQRMNGVLNIGRMSDSNFPVWSPLDTKAYEKYIGGNVTPKRRDDLTEQLIHILYTVRNNLVHGCKRADDANSREVVERANPLISMIVSDCIL